MLQVRGDLRINFLMIFVYIYHEKINVGLIKN